jgi:hypothetical protein
VVTKPSWATWSGSVLSGTPTVSGTYSFSIKATSTAGSLSDWHNWTVIVSHGHWAPTIWKHHHYTSILMARTF